MRGEVELSNGSWVINLLFRSWLREFSVQRTRRMKANENNWRPLFFIKRHKICLMAFRYFLMSSVFAGNLIELQALSVQIVNYTPALTLSGSKKRKLSEHSTRYFRKFMFKPSHPCSIPVTSEVFIADKNNNFPSPRIYCCFRTIEIVLSPCFQFFQSISLLSTLTARLCCWEESQLMKIWILSIGNNLEWRRRCGMKPCSRGWRKLSCVNSFMLGTCSGSSGFAYFPSRVSFIHSKGQNTKKEAKTKKIEARQATDQLRSITLIRWLIKITRASLR